MVKSIAASIVTRTSTSFGIALAVRVEPRSEIRRTPGQARAASTKASTATSSGRRGSATEGDGARGWLRRFGSKQMSESAKHPYSFQLLFEIGSVPKVVEFVLHAPTDALCSRSHFAEAFNIGASFCERQAQYAIH